MKRTSGRASRPRNEERRSAIGIFSAKFQADQFSIRDTLRNIRAEMEERACPSEFIGRVEGVLAELFNNIAEHAYEDRGKGTIQCSASLDKATWELAVDVVDFGLAMPAGELPGGTLPDLDVSVADLPEGGFGWFIIRSQTDHLSHERVGTENHTLLRFSA